MRIRKTDVQIARESKRGSVPKRKNFRLHQFRLDAARKALGTSTETETIERALEFAAFGERLASGTKRARGRHWNDIFAETVSAGSTPDK